MSNDNVTKTTRVGWFFPALFLLFLGLKLGGVIDWSWWWVSSPLWLPVAILFGLAAIFATLSVIFGGKKWNS